MDGRSSTPPWRGTAGRWLLLAPIPVGIPRFDHLGPHNPIEWVIWLALMAVVLLVGLGVINRRVPPR